MYPHDQTLRHYVGLSWSHAIFKRADRTYPRSDLDRGWHGNRLDFTLAHPIVTSPFLREAIPWDTRSMDRSAVSRLHFWERGFEETATAPAG